MKFRKEGLFKRSTLDLTPMIDVVFNLLLFFVVATFMSSRQGIKVNLPITETAKKEAVSKKSDLTITEDLQLFLNDTKISIEDLTPSLTKELAQSADKTLLIRADGAVPHRIVMHVMDEANKVGFVKLSFAANLKR